MNLLLAIAHSMGPTLSPAVYEPAGETAAQPPDEGPFVPTEVIIPYPWLEYCHRSGDLTCRVDEITPTDLAYVNMLVSNTLTSIPNPDPLDPWEAFPASRTGDCDDDVVTKRAALLALGIPARDMRIEVGEVFEPDGRIAGHAVLIVALNGKEWTLDRKTPDRIYNPSFKPYTFMLTARQTYGGLVWVRPGDPYGTPSSAAAPSPAKVVIEEKPMRVLPVPPADLSAGEAAVGLTGKNLEQYLKDQAGA